MPAVKVGDISLYFEQSGQGSPVVLAHAFLDNCSVWKAQVDVLAQGHRVIPYDHRGHGRSDKPKGGYSVQALADDLNGLMLALKLDRAAVVGNSIGGMVIMRLALDHPERVSRMVLVCTTPRLVPQLPVVCSTVGRMSSLFPYRMFARALQRTKMHRPSEEAGRQALERSRQVPRHAAYAIWQSLLTSYDVRSQLSGIAVPTLIVAGGKDFTIPMAMNRLMNREIEGSRLEVMPDCGHLPMIERPEEFNRILTGFLG